MKFGWGRLVLIVENFGRRTEYTLPPTFRLLLKEYEYDVSTNRHYPRVDGIR